MSAAEPGVPTTARRGATGRTDPAASRLASETELRMLESRSLLPPLAVAASLGLLVVAGALALSRSDPTSGLAELLFWTGLILVVVPFAFRLATTGPDRTERLASIVVLGLLLYLVKLVHDPYAFVYSDEWVHTYNAQEIVRTGALFHPNPIIPVTARYPGLETVTAAVASSSGLSVFAAGAILLGAARIVLVLALFLLFERLTGSARIASIAGLVYVTNPNFLFWSAQFSYESLALSLIGLAAVATVAASVRNVFPAERSRIESGGPSAPERRRPERRSWTIVACLASIAAAATHHLSAYALCIFLAVVCVHAAFHPRTRRHAPWLIAAVAVVATVAWAFWVAPGTSSYLLPVLRRAFHETIDTIAGRTSARGLFQAGRSHQQVAPTWQRVIAIASVALVVVALPFGLREILRRFRARPMVVVLGVAAVVYVAVLPMRLVPAAWETSNRSSEFLYVGVALAIALAATMRRFMARRFAIVASAAAGVLLVGGVVAGWPPRVLLSLPYRVQASGAVIPSQPRAAADWTRTVLGSGHRFIAPEAIGRELLVHGGEATYVTSARFDARSVLYAGFVTAGIVDTLATEAIDYVELSRRPSSNDNMAGYFFLPRDDRDFVDPLTLNKYDVFPGVDRLLDTGDIFVYDLRALAHVAG